MPVVINEFEVVNEPAAPPAQPQTASAKPAPPVDVERALAAISARAQRVRMY
jgi:hypothetical protein